MSVASQYRRMKIIEGHYAEGEPKTMSRVQGMAEERWPKHAATFWVTRESPRRHVSVRFGTEALEGAADLWLDAFHNVDVKRQLARIDISREFE